MSGFTSLGEEFDRLFITDSEIVDRYVGNLLWDAGDNAFGQLGDNTTVDHTVFRSMVTNSSDWYKISKGVGSLTLSAIKTDGTLWLWGRNTVGQLGDNTITQRNSPVQTITGGTNWKQVSGGYFHTVAIKKDGTLWSWGYNYSGQLGLGYYAALNKGNSSPIQISGGGTNWKQVSGGVYHTAAIKTDGTLWTWGHNTWGQLGQGTTANTNVPAETISGGSDWNIISCGFHTAAIKTDGTLWLWGRNDTGQLGINSIANTSTPVQVTGGGTNWKQVSGGVYHTAAIKTDGTLWLWGLNSFGQLGINSTANTSTPVQVIGGGTNWKQVYCGAYHTAAIKTDGTLWTWGRNNVSQLGDNTLVSKSSPIQPYNVQGLNWVDLMTGADTTYGLISNY